MSATGRPSADSKAVSARIPVMGLVLSMLATLFLGGGALGLIEPATAPQLAAPAVAWSLIAVGIVLDIAAIMVVLGARKTRARRGG